VHLQVGDTDTADRFWNGVLGFDITSRYPGASFYGSGGYHHQIAANIWNSRGAGALPDGMAGLSGFDLVARDQSVLEAVAARAEAANRMLSRTEDTVLLSDPWNVRIALKA
jgi:catechol 2,3-dioxygenase